MRRLAITLIMAGSGLVVGAPGVGIVLEEVVEGGSGRVELYSTSLSS